MAVVAVVVVAGEVRAMVVVMAIVEARAAVAREEGVRGRWQVVKVSVGT